MAARRFTLTWDEVQRYSMALAWKIGETAPDGQPWQGVVAITKGGMVPAAIIARELKISVIETFCVRSYQGQQQRDLEVLKLPQCPEAGRNWLVVDDIADTGHTSALVRKTLPQARLVALYVKEKGRASVDDFMIALGDDTWVYFPWEFMPAIAPHAGEE